MASHHDVQLDTADLVESATHELHNGTPDWSVNMQLVDTLNTRPAEAGVLLGALKKRLGHKNHAIGLLAVILLEALVKNAPRNLLPLMATPEFMEDFVRILPKQIRDPGHKGFFGSLKDYARDIQAVERYDKVLLCIESWAEAFGGRGGSYDVFATTYRSLQRAGVRFPEKERDEMAPVTTPALNAAVLAKKEQEKRAQLAALQEAQRAEAARKEDVLRQQQREMVSRMRDAECRAAVEQSQLFSDMLSQTPEGTNLERDELVQAVRESLRPLALKIQSRLEKGAAADQREDVLAELLQANDSTMEAGFYYEGLVKGTMKRKPPPQPIGAAAPAAAHASAVGHSPAASPAASPASGRKNSSESKAASSRAPVPLLQPPPASAASGGGSGSNGPSPARRRSDASQAALRTPPASIPAPEIDLLSFASPPPPAVAAQAAASRPAPSYAASQQMYNQQQQAFPGAFDAFAPQAQAYSHPPATAAAASASSGFGDFDFDPRASSSASSASRHAPAPMMSGSTNDASLYPSVAGAFEQEVEGRPNVVQPYEQQRNAIAQANRGAPVHHQQKAPIAVFAPPQRTPVQSPSRTAFALAPPPGVQDNASFFTSSGLGASPASSFPAASASRAQPQPQPSSLNILATEKTPFDESPDPSDPWQALALRSSPPAGGSQNVQSFGQASAAAPAARQGAHASGPASGNAQQTAEQKKLQQDFDLLSFAP